MELPWTTSGFQESQKCASELSSKSWHFVLAFRPAAKGRHRHKQQSPWHLCHGLYPGAAASWSSFNGAPDINRTSEYIWVHNDRRKFRSQTSDNMDRWKGRGRKSQRREEKKREVQRRESVRRKKIQVREKVGKSQNTVFFSWFVARRVEK